MDASLWNFSLVKRISVSSQEARIVDRPSFWWWPTPLELKPNQLPYTHKYFTAAHSNNSYVVLESTEAEHIGGFPFHSTFFPEKHNELASINNLLPNMHICIVLVHFKAFLCTRTKKYVNSQHFRVLLHYFKQWLSDEVSTPTAWSLRLLKTSDGPSSMLRADESRAPHHLDGPRR